MEVRSRTICKKGQSAAQCKVDFLDAHPEFEYVKVLGDGNCFFRSIAAYYQRNPQLTIDGVHNPKDHNELRQYVVHRFGQQITDPQDNYEKELRDVYLPALNERSVEEILSELATTCTWNVPAFEMMVERTAPILNINLRLFRMNEEKIDPNKPLHKNNKILTITESFYHSRTPGSTTISILLIGGHYELLYPTNLNYNMEAAIAASMNGYSMNKLANPQHINTNNQKYAEEFQQLKINNKKPAAAPNSYDSNSSVVSNASIASSVNSINGNIENAKKTYPYKTTTVKEIKAMLDNYGIGYHSKDNKEMLYGTFLMAFMKNMTQRAKNILQSQKQASKQANKVASRKVAKNAKWATKKNKS
jgi:hypothetical protein